MTKCLIHAGQKVIHIRAEMVILLGSFLGFEKRGELRTEGLEIVVKAKNAFRAQLRQTQDSSCLLRSRHFPSELLCDPDDTFNEFCVILGENTL
jgi:hypothetical protein